MAADHAPFAVSFSRPDSRVAVGPAHELPGYLYLEPRSERRHDDVRCNSAHAQLFRHMRPEPDEPGPMRLEILRLGSELPVRTREQELIGDQPIERRNVRRELRGAKLRFERDALRDSGSARHLSGDGKHFGCERIDAGLL